MAGVYPLLVLLLVPCLLQASAQETMQQEDDCLEDTRPHLSRCDQYFRCTVLETGAHVWVAAQCHKGLVYMHNLRTCVVPDSDWECDLSAENEHYHSDENVYGIDNLSNSLTDIVTTTSAANEGRERSEDVLRLKNSSPEFNDIESSGDGSTDRLEDDLPAVKTKPSKSQDETKPSSFVTTKPPRRPSGILSQSQLESFLAYYDAQSDPKVKTRQPPLSEKNHLAHLQEIIKQQNQLNRAGNQITDTVFSSAKPIASIDHSKTKEADVHKEALSKVKLPPGMEDIIRSILEISQQAIANQKLSAVEPAKDPIVKPIFIPISVNPIQTSAGSLPEAVNAQDDRTKLNPVSANNPTPISLTGGVSTSLDYQALFNNFRNHPVNDTTLYERPQQVLYDAYGNRYVPKDSYHLVPPNDPSYAYNPYTGVSLQPPVVNRPAAASLFAANNWTPYGPSQQVHEQQQHDGIADAIMYQQRIGPLPPQSQTVDNYDKLSNIIERIKQLDSLDTSENDNGSDSEPTDDEDAADSGETSDEDGPPSGVSSKLKRKLFTLGDSTFDYDQYKDSMLPLVEANPNDDRISVVTCVVGSRQANRTDCFRYYICNPHNGVFQTYTCPSFTAFNKNSRMCDTASYKPCKVKSSPPVTVRPLKQRKGPSPQSTGISQLKNELRTAQRYVVELIRAEAENLRLHNTVQSSASKIIFLPSMDSFSNAGALPSKAQRKPASAKRKPVTTTTAAPVVKKTTASRKVPRCRLEGRMPDPMDHTNYFVCHRKSPNKFIKLKMACPGSLIYCAASQYCTVATNC